MRRVGRTVLGVVVVAVVVAVLALPLLVCWHVLRTFGVRSLIAVIPIAAVWLMIAAPLIALSVQLVHPELAREGRRRHSGRPAASYPAYTPLHAARRDDRASPRPAGLSFGDRYGLRWPMLTVIALAAVAGTIATYYAAT